MQGQSVRGRMRVRAPFSVLPGVVVASMLLVGPMLVAARAAESEAKPERRSAAERLQIAKSLVDEALHREVYGAEEQREKLLGEALGEVESYAPARWHQGYVREHKRWVRHDALPQMKPDYRLLAAYQTRRERTADTVAGQLDLAKWCKTRGLADQARAHLTRVLELNPNQTEARELLGHRHVGDRWISRREIEESTAAAEVLRGAMRQWTPKLRRLLVRLESPSKRTREAAAQQLQEIDDAAAIPVIEAVVSTKSAQSASYAVDSLAGMTAPPAAVSLARHAVFSPWDNVRRSAAEKLKDKPMEHYVPVLLNAMQSPVQARRELYTTSSGQLSYRYTVFREGRRSNELAVFETAYVRLRREGGDARETLGRAVGDVVDRNTVRDVSLARQNEATVRLNFRIAETLVESTGEKLPPEPTEWWKWWDDYNEVFVALEKPTAVSLERDVVRVEDTQPIEGGTRDRSRRREREEDAKDCLAAGTPVWTETGLVAIEKIRIGDRVLSQNPRTGELAYKPVLRTTIRPTGRLTRIHLPGGETIATSGGHLFWCSGDGWVRSRDIKSGMLLHTVDGTRHVSYVDKSGNEPTYNLIVADFNTYFAGKAKVLNHDNTVSSPTDNVVPGFAGK